MKILAGYQHRDEGTLCMWGGIAEWLANLIQNHFRLHRGGIGWEEMWREGGTTEESGLVVTAKMAQPRSVQSENVT